MSREQCSFCERWRDSAELEIVNAAVRQRIAMYIVCIDRSSCEEEIKMKSQKDLVEKLKTEVPRAIGEHVLLQVLAKPTTSKGGIFLPGAAAGREDMATVLSVGSRVKLDDGHPRAGDVVRFDPYAVKLVFDTDGPSVVASAHARAGAMCIVHSDALIYVET